MSDADVLTLTCDKEEAAFHEAGHAAIELRQGLIPQLILIYQGNAQWEGGCYTPVLPVPSQSDWRAQEAIAGVLSQAKYVAEKRLPGEAVLDQEMNGQRLVQFFLAPPDPERTCAISWSDPSSGHTAAVDIAKGYPDGDHLHFRTAILDLAKAAFPGVKFSGDEPACVAEALKVVNSCVTFLNDRSAWKHVKELAEVLLKTTPVTAHMVSQKEIERVASVLLVH